MNAWCWNGWMHGVTYLLVIILMLCVSMSAHCLGMWWFFTWHGSRWPLPGIVPCYVLHTFTYDLWFLHGRDVPHFMWCTCCLIVTNFVWSWIMAMEINFVCLTSDSLTAKILMKPLHIVFLQFYRARTIKETNPTKENWESLSGQSMPSWYYNT